MRHPKDTFFKAPFSLVLMGIFLMLMIWPVVPAWAAPGDLDITFSGDGYDIRDVSPGYEDTAQAVAIDSSGRAVVAGYLLDVDDYNFMVLRYKTDGTLDETFDGDGIVTTDVSGSGNHDFAYAVAIADDGDIIVAGKSSDGGNHDFALVRYNPDGSLDTGFGVNGIVTTDISSGNDDGIRSMAIYQSGPKAGYIVVAGYATSGTGDFDFAIAQYTPSGALDMGGFNDPNGYLTLDFDGYNDEIYGVAIDGNNKIVVAGTATDSFGDPYFALCRYNDTGVFDAAFNSGSPYTHNLVSGTFTDEGIRAVAIQNDNKILVTGYGINPGNAEDVVVLRLMSDGALDFGFASPAGYVMTDINGATHNDRGHAIALASDGDIVVGCYHLGGDSEDFALLRYDTNGGLDPAFGTGGMVVTDLGGAVHQDVINGLALQADGKAVVAGESRDTETDTAVARYEMNATYYVDITAVDNSGDGSELNPWKTVHYAVSQLSAGDRLYVKQGTYSETNYAGVGGPPPYAQLEIPDTLDNIEIIGDPGGTTPIIDYAPVSAGPWMDGLIIHADHVTIRNLAFTGFPWKGLVINGAQNTIDACSFYGNTQCGIYISDLSTPSVPTDPNNVIQNNCEIYENAWGIEIYNSPNNLIQNNGASIYDNGDVYNGTGIIISGSGAQNNDIYNTRIYDDPSTTGFVQTVGISISDVGVGSQIDIEECSIEDHGQYGIYFYNSGARIKRNKLVGNYYGLYVEAYSAAATPAIWNNLIHGGELNTMDYGIYIYSDSGDINSNLTIYHNTIYGANLNGIENFKGGLGTCDPSIFFNIISDYSQYGINNTAGDPSVGWNDVFSFGTTSTPYYGFGSGFSGGAGAISAEPMYVSPGDDFHLASGSPCIDAIDKLLVSDSVCTDLDHPDESSCWRPQPAGGNKDMGCYELLGASATVMPHNIPDTGQSACYDDSGVITCPAPGAPFHGQDYQYQPQIPRSYTKLGAGGAELPDGELHVDDGGLWIMTRDNVTGLIWEMKTDANKDITYTWEGATTTFIDALNTGVGFGEFTDWRLPTVKELVSLVNLGVWDPSIDSFWFPNAGLDFYWSSTPDPVPSLPDNRLGIDFGRGWDGGEDKGNLHYARAVRDGMQPGIFDDAVPSGRLVDNGDGTITDTGTGLMWQQATNPTEYDWQGALNYAENLALPLIDPHTDWRLPNLHELRSIVDYTRYNPVMDPLLFPDAGAFDWFWSSTSYAPFPALANAIDFLEGGDYQPTKDILHYVRAVRGGQFGTAGDLAISNKIRGKQFAIGDLLPINWDTSFFTSDVRILLSRDGGRNFFEITASAPNSGEYEWTITDPATVNAVLRIEQGGDPTTFSEIGFFTLGEIFNLFVTKAGAGTGTVTSSPAGIDCGASCVGVFPAATLIEISASADPGSAFAGWTDGTGSSAGCSGTGTCSFVISETSSITANFVSAIGPGEYYVDSENGDDASGDGSIAGPWQTLHYAIEQINGGTAGIYTLHVLAGEYKLLSSGGSEPDEVLYITQNNLTIIGAGSATILDGSFVSAPLWTDGLDIQSATNVVIQDLLVKNFSANGIHMGGAESCTVDACTIYNNSSHGISIEEGGIPFGPSSNNIIQNCSIYDNGNTTDTGFGIYIYGSGSNGNLIYQNTIYSDDDTVHPQCLGVEVSEAGTGNQIVSNTIYGHQEVGGFDGFGIEAVNCSPDILQNILYDNTQAIVVLSEDGGTASPNIWNNLLYDNPDTAALNMTMGIMLEIEYDAGYTGPLSTLSPAIYHNTITGAMEDGIRIDVDPLGGNGQATIEFNIISDAGTGGIRNTLGYADPMVDMNNIWDTGVSGTDYYLNFASLPTSDIHDDPVYVGAGDYHLQSISPCIDAIPAPTLPPFHPVDIDLDGVARPQPVGGDYDMGCYEYVTEVPPPEYYTVTFKAETGGSITGDPIQTVREGTNCSPVTAVADDGYRFIGWTGSYRGTANPLTITNVRSDKNITANFEPELMYTVNFTAGPGGSLSGNVSQSVSPGGNCTAVTAVPDDGYDFDGWSGDHVGEENPLILTGITSDKNITANFRIKTYEVSILPGEGGGIEGETFQTVGHGGTTTILTAVPEPGYHFVDWSGDYTGTENPLVLFNVTSDLNITANFAINIYNVMFYASAGGSISGQAEQLVEHGASSTPVRAEADVGYEFTGWSGHASGKTNPLTLENIISDMTVTANFTDNDSPNTPELISPIGNSLVDAGRVMLLAGNYSDPEGNDHIESRWQIWRTGESDPFYTVSTSADLTEHIPDPVFENGVRYEWRVGFVDEGSRLISWSARGAFIVGIIESDGDIPPVPPGFTMKDYRLVSFIQWPDSDPFSNPLNMLTSADTSQENFKFGIYEPLNGGYDQYPDITIEPGRAYWILARYGMSLAMNGVFVSMNHDFTLKLGYDVSTGNGWSMIGSPNGAYLWYDLEVIETDDQDNILFGPVPISLLPAGNEYIDKRIWRWEGGGYATKNSDSFVLNPYEGAWVKAKKKNIALVFPVSAQSNPLLLSRMYLKIKTWAADLMDLTTSAHAGHAEDDSPPMPMEVAGDSSSSGCFIETISKKINPRRPD